jgi:hypothetical protein
MSNTRRLTIILIINIFLNFYIKSMNNASYKRDSYTPNKAFCCYTCGKQYNKKANLWKHMKHGCNPSYNPYYTCLVCNDQIKRTSKNNHCRSNSHIKNMDLCNGLYTNETVFIKTDVYEFYNTQRPLYLNPTAKSISISEEMDGELSPININIEDFLKDPEA